MPEDKQTTGQQVTPFGQWLDTVVPAVFKSDAELARALGVNQGNVTRWRKGRVPGVQSLYRLAEVTGVSMEYLMRVAGYRPATPDTEDKR